MFNYEGYDVEIEKCSYNNGKQILLTMAASETENNENHDLMPGEPIAVATISIPEYDFKVGETALDTYHVPLIFFYLKHAGVIEETGKTAICSNQLYPVVKVII